MTEALALNETALGAVALRLPSPRYDRRRVETGVAHIGVGVFHRAHQCWYHDRLLEEPGNTGWGICGIGLMPADEPMRDSMAAQDGLYTLVATDGRAGADAQVIGSIVEYLYAPDDAEAAIEKLASRSIRIVSLTITEGGYNVDDVTGEFKAGDTVEADLVPGAIPHTVFGIVIEALRRRRDRGIPPFTVMSCDNLPGNGSTSRRAFATFAEWRDPDLGRWVREHVAFPNGMVDRITPAPTAAVREMVATTYGIDDRIPVFCERFAQWVLEDDFPAGRPPYERVGVQLVEDVVPYELMKLRLVNASHQALCYLAALAGFSLVADAVRDPSLSGFLSAFMHREAIPTVPPVPNVDLDEYAAALLERFDNPSLGDTIARLATDGSDRIPKFVLPILRRQLELGGDIRRTAAIIAAWARYTEGLDDQGNAVEVVDRMRGALVERAREAEQPGSFISHDIFGDLAENERFLDAFLQARSILHAQGARSLARVLA